ncbi:MAG: agmatinase [bacterium]|jgi:agmatinase|nr:agmatinase [bacterium]
MMTGFGDFAEHYSGYNTARVALLPVPFDKTCSWMTGASKGPEAILKASYYLENYDIETGEEVYRKGIHTDAPIVAETSQEMIARVSARVAELTQDGKFVVTLGGEHSISQAPVNALVERYPALSVLHLDAHGDTRDEYEGSKYSHASVMARIREKVTNVVSVGIRSIEAEERKVLDPARTFFAYQIHDSYDWIDQAVALLNDPVYVTIDVDVFDPSELPATGTPEPGGLRWYMVMKLLRTLSQKRKIAGFDVVELSPTDHKASDFLTAKLIYTFLSYISHDNAWDF